MISPLQALTKSVSSRRGSIAVVGVWLSVLIVLMVIAPGAKEHAVGSSEGSAFGRTPSAEAREQIETHFPSEDGAAALLVFHHPSGPITPEQLESIIALSEWLSSDSKPEHVASSLPFHRLPVDVRERFLSEDGSTMLLNAAMREDASSREILDTLDEIRAHAEETGLHGLKLDVTGPAGIAGDTVKLFSDADLVLLLATVGLILVILIAIYRSPLLALLPLLVAGIVYAVVDRLLGLAAQAGWIAVDKQALSIMMILLFAVLTDYCLFVVSRFREELGRTVSKHEAMRAAMSQVGEPILFSGGTVLLAVIALFAAAFEPYHSFAPVFTVAMIVILLGGLTLIPAVFTLAGRAAIRVPHPKLPDKRQKRGLWDSVARLVATRPAAVAAVISVAMVAASANALGIGFSFNLLKSFPEDMSSRAGFERLEESFSEGLLAPVTVVLESETKMEITDEWQSMLASLRKELSQVSGISDAGTEQGSLEGIGGGTSQGESLSSSGRAFRFELTLTDHPFEKEALRTVKTLRDGSRDMLREAGFDPNAYRLHFAGQTAQQLDVRDMNERDTIVVFALVTLLITIMLLFQARSILIGIAMMATMLLSYAAALGIGWGILRYGFGYEAFSYRLPLYSFVFLIALGVDYNIMLVSRITEESKRLPWKNAVQEGLARTGSVISSAGVILAATFCVLMTQPMQELFMFGFIMSIGILLDTFIIRGMLLPAILVLMGRWMKAGANRGMHNGTGRTTAR
ncbi:MMPL family transporter [Paenibacillus sp. LHD-117]|uniref:MMPL family transporter n=1 Tax=Paenibacillus sp. LHD-117 TaxID=3071412 RepID=UPI0027E1B442|nr:MMPL family transporter [Paenibacillus sp. LHD-117]MDQ6419472.1 MMPL family transporter [Paenibacillus sp. LHD-117]